MFKGRIISFFSAYGSVTERMLPENEPPVTVPEYFSATPAPFAPALPGTETVKVFEAPAASTPVPPRLCGTGAPEAEPRVAEFRVMPFTVLVPLFFTVIVNVYPLPADPDTEDVVESDTAGGWTTVI